MLEMPENKKCNEAGRKWVGARHKDDEGWGEVRSFPADVAMMRARMALF